MLTSFAFLAALAAEPGPPPAQPPTETIQVLEPTGAFPAPPPSGQARNVSLGLSAGPGWLALHDRIGRDGQGALALSARLGVIIAPQWNLFLGGDFASTRRGDSTFSQSAVLLGIERFFLGRIYLGAAPALGAVQQSGGDGLSDGPGYGFSAHAGVEALRTAHVGLTVELGLTALFYEREAWEMGGLRAGVIFF
jgi:hypothetical protein